MQRGGILTSVGFYLYMIICGHKINVSLFLSYQDTFLVIKWSNGAGIFYSHAFDYGIMREKYYARYSSKLKNEINCIFWKEGIDNIIYCNIIKT